jgi:hypothetical protein
MADKKWFCDRTSQEITSESWSKCDCQACVMAGRILFLETDLINALRMLWKRGDTHVKAYVKAHHPYYDREMAELEAQANAHRNPEEISS